MEGRLQSVHRLFVGHWKPSGGHRYAIELAPPDFGEFSNTGGAHDLVPRLHLGGVLQSGETIDSVRSALRELPGPVAVTVREWTPGQVHLLLTGVLDHRMLRRIQARWRRALPRV